MGLTVSAVIVNRLHGIKIIRWSSVILHPYSRPPLAIEAAKQISQKSKKKKKTKYVQILRFVMKDEPASRLKARDQLI